MTNSQEHPTSFQMNCNFFNTVRYGNRITVSYKGSEVAEINLCATADPRAAQQIIDLLFNEVGKLVTLEMRECAGAVLGSEAEKFEHALSFARRGFNGEFELCYADHACSVYITTIDKGENGWKVQVTEPAVNSHGEQFESTVGSYTTENFWVLPDLLANRFGN